MLTLHEYQRQFAMGLNSESDEFLQVIIAGSGLTQNELFAIYRGSSFGALQAALKEIYPVVHRLVGEDFFIAMINFYISSHASYFPDLARYGADFAEFIRHYAPAQSLSYLPDVARLEWAWHKVSIAPSSPAINFQKLGECYAEHGERLVFDIPADFSLLASQYPIHEIWEKNQPECQGDADIVLPDSAIFYYFVCCVHDVMRIDYLTKEEWQVLSWIRKGMNLAKVVENIHVSLPEVNIVELLPRMIERGWLADFKIR